MFIAFFVLSCTKDDDFVIQSKPISSVQVGYEGAIIEENDLLINIPEGAIANTTTIDLLKNNRNSAFDGHEASDFFTIDGLPGNFEEPIEIVISNSSDDLFPVIGEIVQVSGEGGPKLSFRFPEMQRTGKDYSFEIFPPESGTWSDTLQVVIGLVKDFIKIDGSDAYSQNAGNTDLLKSTEASERFVVYSPAIYTNAAISLLNNLELAYTKFKSSDFGFSYDKRTKWPVQATIMDLGSGTYGYFVPSKFGDNYGTLEFNKKFIQDEEQNRVSAGHEFFHLVQALYDPRYAFVKGVAASDYLWLQEAASVWSEELFSAKQGYVSSIRGSREMAPFKGMDDGAKENAAHHGYGMSAFIKYIADKYGKEKIKELFEYQKKGYLILPAFTEIVPDNLGETYVEFIDEYIQHNIYSDFSINNILGAYDGVFDIKSKSDTLKLFTTKYPGLSAKIYRVNFDNNELTQENSLYIKSTHDPVKLIYKVKGSELNLLGKIRADFELTNLKQIQDEKAVILIVCVGRNYTEEEETLELHVNTKPPFQYDHCKFTLKYMPVVHQVEYQGNISTQDVVYSFTYDNFYRSGTYKDYSFESNWDEIDGNWRHFGHMTLKIDETTSKIVEGSIRATLESENNPQNAYKILEIDFKDAKGSMSETYGSFSLLGESFCSNITHYDAVEDMNGFYRTTLSYSCSNTTSLSITLHVGDE